MISTEHITKSFQDANVGAESAGRHRLADDQRRLVELLETSGLLEAVSEVAGNLNARLSNGFLYKLTYPEYNYEKVVRYKTDLTSWADSYAESIDVIDLGIELAPPDPGLQRCRDCADLGKTPAFRVFHP